ncbi:MAG: hypothetical protein R3284_01000 [Rubricoccaceae bacterium]|nr:hypothetical protein [Rubricoccaceae bacterium]
MRARLVPFILPLLILGACGENSDEADSIEVDSVLVEALAEWHLGEAREALLRQSVDSLRNESLDSLGIDSAEIVQSIEEMAANPDKASAVYDAVEEILREERRAR